MTYCGILCICWKNIKHSTFSLFIIFLLLFLFFLSFSHSSNYISLRTLVYIKRKFKKIAIFWHNISLVEYLIFEWFQNIYASINLILQPRKLRLNVQMVFIVNLIGHRTQSSPIRVFLNFFWAFDRGFLGWSRCWIPALVLFYWNRWGFIGIRVSF